MIATRIAALGDTTERTSAAYVIAEMIGRYRVQHHGSWRVYNIARCELLPATYESEDLARAGAHLNAALDIIEMLEKPT